MSDFTFYTTENSQGEAKQILDEVNNKYGFVPNLFAYMAEAPYTIEAYSMLNEILAKTDLSPAQQQVGLLAVSAYHDCEFCRVAHQAFGKMNKAIPQTLLAIVAGEEIEDASDRALVKLLTQMLDNRGWVNQEQLDPFYQAGFNKRNVYDLILIVTIKTLSNYSNHLTKPEANQQLKAML